MIKKTVLAVLVAALMVASLPGAGLCQGARVVVFPFKNNGQPQQNGLASGLAAMFMTDLTQVKGMEVADPQMVTGAIAKLRLTGGAPAVEDALKAADTIGADYAVMGEFVVFGSRFRIDVRVYDVKAGTVKVAEKAQAKEDALFETVDDLSGRIALAISGTLPVAGGGIDIKSEPPGAEIQVDGEKSGQTPLAKTDIAPGRHKVELYLNGYQPFSQEVTVTSHETAKVDAKLVRLYGGVRVWWNSFPLSDVSISGPVADTIKSAQFMGNFMLGKYCRNLPAGEYTVTVRLPYKEYSSWDTTRSWKTYTADADVTPGEVVDIFINNNVYTPGIELNSCSSCAANWDFKTSISWYEMQ